MIWPEPSVLPVVDLDHRDVVDARGGAVAGQEHEVTWLHLSDGHLMPGGVGVLAGRVVLQRHPNTAPRTSRPRETAGRPCHVNREWPDCEPAAATRAAEC